MIGFLLTLLLTFQIPVKPPSPRPDVLIVILDDVGAYDVDRVKTPTLDWIAANSRNFVRGYSMPVCAPTRATMMFGVYDEDLGPVCSDIPNDQTPPSEALNLPRVFGRQGYQTAFFGKWHLGTNTVGLHWELTPQAMGYHQSFAVVPGNVNSPCDGFEGDYYRWLAIENGTSYIERRYQTIVLRDKFIDWWDGMQGPKFAVLSFQAAHAPFDEPPPELLPYLPADDFSDNRYKYEKLVISVDVVLSQVLSFVSKDTFVILVGDNGTPPNAIGPGQNRDKVKTSPYEGGVRVPFMIMGPGIKPGESDALVSVADILPTLAELFGDSIDSIDGLSLVPALKDPNTDIHDFVFVSSDGNRAVIGERYKLVRLENRQLFFDLLLDPTESNPIDPNTLDQDMVEKMRVLMATYIARGL